MDLIPDEMGGLLVCLLSNTVGRVFLSLDPRSRLLILRYVGSVVTHVSQTGCRELTLPNGAILRTCPVHFVREMCFIHSGD